MECWGGKLELLLYNDASDPATAVRLYEKLITQDKVDLVLGQNGSATTEAVADVIERHRIPMVAPIAADTSIYSKGQKFIFGMLPSVRVYLEGLIDMAAKKGLQVVFVEAYPPGTTDFSAILTKVQAANPDVLGSSTRVLGDAAAITRQMKSLKVNPRMRDAEFVYSSTPWVPELVEVRAGGLIPIARQYPGAREFVESHRKEFPGANLSHHSAAGYGGCQVLVESQ